MRGFVYFLVSGLWMALCVAGGLLIWAALAPPAGDFWAIHLARGSATAQPAACRVESVSDWDAALAAVPRDGVALAAAWPRLRAAVEAGDLWPRRRAAVVTLGFDADGARRQIVRTVSEDGCGPARARLADAPVVYARGAAARAMLLAEYDGLPGRVAGLLLGGLLLFAVGAGQVLVRHGRGG